MQTNFKPVYLIQFNRHLLNFFCAFCFGLLHLEQASAQDNQAEPFVLNNRIGLVIDSMEAEYFNLFPTLDGVKSAVYRRDNFGNVRMLLSLSNGKDTTLTFSKLAAAELSKYIEKQEILTDSSNIINWSLLPGYGLSRLNFFENHGSMVYVRMMDKTTIGGKLLRLTDSTVILWTSMRAFRPQLFPEYIKSIPVQDIQRIDRKQDLSGKIFGITIGVGLGVALFAATVDIGSLETINVQQTLAVLAAGALIGGGLGFIYDFSTISRRKYRLDGQLNPYLKIKSNLEKRAMFSKIYPPELYN
jgi:hypothetical protein